MRTETEVAVPSSPGINPDSAQQYAARAEALRAIVEADVPIVVAGAYAMREYAGIIRDTKDLDVFCRRRDVEGVLQALAASGFRTEVTDPVWLAKGYHPCGEFVDVIFSSGNGVADVDAGWFERARQTIRALAAALPDPAQSPAHGALRHAVLTQPEAVTPKVRAYYSVLLGKYLA